MLVGGLYDQQFNGRANKKLDHNNEKVLRRITRCGKKRGNDYEKMEVVLGTIHYDHRVVSRHYLYR